MGITQILLLALIAILLRQLKRGRSLSLLAVSTLAIYWLQPVQSPVNITFWFPTFTLFIVVFTWWVVFSSSEQTWKSNLLASLVLAGVVLLIGLNRYLQLEQMFITETPRMIWVGLSVAMVVSPALPLARGRQNRPGQYLGLIFLLIGLLVITRLPSVMPRIYETMLSLRGKAIPAAPNAFVWLGFSYVVFRLLHTIFDRRAGRLELMPLAAYINYVIFFPAFVSGPIDRYQRFVQELDYPITLDRSGWLEAGTRFFVGLFKKFVLADGLAWIALNQTFLVDTHSAVWLWLFLYAYSFQIYFDFSGYTDMAIGLGRFLGVRLPENFNSPYLKPNITLFWNSWHMSLTQWFRSYYFNPVTRALRTSNWKMPRYLLILFTQTTTMVLIGLWHGITINYLFWGLWHAVGLFIHNRWTDYKRSRNLVSLAQGGEKGWQKSLNLFLTFNFVALGWLFFIFPTPSLTWLAFLKLFGVTS